MIRAAVLADAEALAGVHVRGWQTGYRGILSDDFLASISVAGRAAAWTGWLSADEPETITQVWADPAIAGFCTLRDDEVVALYVDPPRWREGIGGRLMADGLDRLRAAGCDKATLWVFEDNARARAFYDRFGFAPDGERRESERGSSGGVLEIRLRAALGGG